MRNVSERAWRIISCPLYTAPSINTCPLVTANPPTDNLSPSNNPKRYVPPSPPPPHHPTQHTNPHLDSAPRAGLPIGQIHLNGSSLRTTHHRRTELGLDILPQYQGQGYGSEAIRWALDYAFSRTGMHKVRICAFEWNEGACRLYRKLGFKEEGRNREAMWHEGRFWDVVELGMLDREWWAMEGERRKGLKAL